MEKRSIKSSNFLKKPPSGNSIFFSVFKTPVLKCLNVAFKTTFVPGSFFKPKQNFSKIAISASDLKVLAEQGFVGANEIAAWVRIPEGA